VSDDDKEDASSFCSDSASDEELSARGSFPRLTSVFSAASTVTVNSAVSSLRSISKTCESDSNEVDPGSPLAPTDSTLSNASAVVPNDGSFPPELPRASKSFARGKSFFGRNIPMAFLALTRCCAKKHSSSQKEASALLRFVTFGEVPHEENTDEKGPAPCHRGSTHQVRKLVDLWEELDDDKSGAVDMVEFKHCFEPKLRHHYSQLRPGQVLPKWAIPPKRAGDFSKFITRLIESISRQLFAKKQDEEEKQRKHFYLKDLMLSLWLDASPDDLKAMGTIFDEISQELCDERSQVPAPPVLGAKAYEELRAVFLHYCNQDHKVTFDEMVSKDVIDSQEALRARRDWNCDGDGVLDLDLFCEVMCASGYRASAASKVGSTEDGSRIVLDQVSGRWSFVNKEKGSIFFVSECSADQI
jgi:hypothetical protein